MLYARFCPFCSDNGLVGFWKCSDETIMRMCDECNAVWHDPNSISSIDAFYPTGLEFLVAEGCSLRGPRAGWATSAEIEAIGWQSLIAGENEGQ